MMDAHTHTRARRQQHTHARAHSVPAACFRNRMCRSLPDFVTVRDFFDAYSMYVRPCACVCL